MKVKKCVSLLTAMITAGVLAASYSTSAAINMGDIDGNGSVQSSDALEILNHVVGISTLTSEQCDAADIDGDGTISSNDALNVLEYTVNMKNSMYEKYEGTKWHGLFGEQRSETHEDADTGWVFSDLYIEITSVDDCEPSGIIYLSALGMSQKKYFGKEYAYKLDSSNVTTSITDGMFNITDTSGSFNIDIDITFKGDELESTINYASYASQEYKFPAIYFVKSN